MARTGFTAILVIVAALLIVLPLMASAAELDGGEENHLVFMREEEKLARDVYLTLGDAWPEAPVFLTIATTSEQTHTDTMASMLERYSIDDPNPDTNILPDSIGVFTGPVYGWYFTEKFDLLTAWGSKTLLDGLYVGAYIEELDMQDIVDCPKVIVQTSNGVGEGECGLDYTDEQALINTYTNLLEGSKNHLRAYVSNIESIIGAGNYVAQILPQAYVDAILAEESQSGGNRNRGGRRR